MTDTRSTSSASTRSASCRSTRCRRPTAGIPACRSAPRRWPTCCGRAILQAQSGAIPRWPDRDRFVLSAGHGSMLLYSLLHLTGYDLPLDDIKQLPPVGQQGARPSRARPHARRRGDDRAARPGLRQRGRHGDRRGAPGRALQPRRPRGRRPPHLRHRQRRRPDGGRRIGGGVARRPPAARQARSASTTTTTSRSPPAPTSPSPRIARERFEAYGWQRDPVADGNDLEAIDARLHAARAETARPSLILVRTHIGYGSPDKQDSFKAHGSPLGADEVRVTKETLGWPAEPPFLVPERGARALARGARARRARRGGMERAHAAYAQAFPELAARAAARLRGELPAGWDADIPVFPADAKGMATRVAGGKVMNAIAPKLPALIGGSADLDPSTHTALKGLGDFNPPRTVAARTRRVGRRRLELRRPQPALRRARARDGRDRQRPGGARRLHPVRRDLPDLLRLHAPADPPRRADASCTSSTSSPTTASRSARTARRTSRSSSSPACARSRTSP